MPIFALVDWRNFKVTGGDGMGAIDIAHNRVESWECPSCAVRWRSADPTCWNCGRRVES